MRCLPLIAPVVLFLGISLCGIIRAQEESAQEKAGPEHASLKQYLGKWTAKTTMDVGGQKHESSGSENNRFGPGKLWVVSEFRGSFFDQKFHGHGVMGYDTVKKKYVGTWVDSMTSHLSTYEGTYDKKSRTFSFTHTGRNPNGGASSYTSKTVFKDDDHYTMVMSFPGEGSLTIEYTRQAKKPKKPKKKAGEKKEKKKKKESAGKKKEV